MQSIQEDAGDGWRRYRARMIHVLPTLLRWAASFGYIGNDGKKSDPESTTEPDSTAEPDQPPAKDDNGSKN